MTVASIGGGIVAALQLEPGRQTMALGAMAMTLTLLLTLARRDALLLRILGISPALARVIEGLLWSFPLIGLAAMLSLRNGAVIASVVAATAYLSVGLSRSSRSRSPWLVIPGIPTSLPEWMVGLRRSVPLIAVALLVGLVGSGSPGIVIAVLAVLTLTTSTFFWAPAEGWLLIHVREQTASRFLSSKIVLSIGMLSALLVPIALLGALREPSYGGAYLLLLIICFHAHAAAVVAKYASYQEGRSLDAAGTLVWVITAIGIVVPPISILLLLWLYRRAVTRIAGYCVGSQHAK
ncbi:MAG: hypothetical protein IBJ03_02080 [Gemmatimonadaceae bacterium]|nr:hypothetical protein [Gemmatimonadaceae bacterium]